MKEYVADNQKMNDFSDTHHGLFKGSWIDGDGGLNAAIFLLSEGRITECDHSGLIKDGADNDWTSFFKTQPAVISYI